MIFHNKSHNMKALVIYKPFIITISPTYQLTYKFINKYEKELTFVGPCVPFWSIFSKKNSLQIIVII